MPLGSRVATFQSDDRKTLADFPSHSHPLPLIYRSWFKADKAEGHAGGEKLSLLYKLHHKADNQTMTFSQHPQVGGVPLLSPRCERNTRGTHDHPSQQSQTKEMTDTHTHTPRKGHGVTRSRDRRQNNNRNDVWKAWIKIQMTENIQIFVFREEAVTAIFGVWQEKAWRRTGQSERNWSVLAYRHTLHFYHSEGDSAWSDKGGHQSCAAGFWQQHDEDEWTCPNQPETRAAGEMIRLSVTIKAFSSFTHILFLFVFDQMPWSPKH